MARRRYGRQLYVERLEQRLAPTDGLMSFPSGSLVINIGQPAQTVANGLKPYGLVYDLVTNYRVPVD